MICSKCERSIPDDATLCPYCGTPAQTVSVPEERVTVTLDDTITAALPQQDDAPTDLLDRTDDIIPTQELLPTQATAAASARTDAVTLTRPSEAAEPQNDPPPRAKTNRSRRIVILLLVAAMLAVGGFSAYLALKDKVRDQVEETQSDDAMTQAITACVDALNSGESAVPDSIRPDDDFLFSVFYTYVSTVSDATDDSIFGKLLKAILPSDPSEKGLVRAALDKLLPTVKPLIERTLYPAFRRSGTEVLDAGSAVETDAGAEYALLLRGQTFSYNDRTYQVGDVCTVQIAGSPGVMITLAEVDGDWKVILAKPAEDDNA